MLVIPRALDANLLGSQGLNVTEYSVLMNLSEAPGRSLRMSELANYVSISVSGLTRVIERLARQGLVERVRAQSDGRGQVAVLTPAGLDRLQQAWPTHLASVRRHMMDHLDGIDLTAFARAVSAMASTEVGPPGQAQAHRSEQSQAPARDAARAPTNETARPARPGNQAQGQPQCAEHPLRTRSGSGVGSRLAEHNGGYPCRLPRRPDHPPGSASGLMPRDQGHPHRPASRLAGWVECPRSRARLPYM